MQADHAIWQSWHNVLRRWGLQEVAGAFLVSAGSLTILGAQMVFLVEPLLRGNAFGDHLNALGRLLEQPEQVHAFIKYMKDHSST